MKKRFFVTILAVFLLFSAAGLAISVAADGETPAVTDKTGLLTSAERDALTRAVNDFESRYNMVCMLVLIDSLDGESAEVYADDFFDEHAYRASGVVFLVSVSDRECHISTGGDAISLISDYEIELILDDVTYYLADDDWYGGLAAFVPSAGRMIERENGGGHGGKPDYDHSYDYDYDYDYYRDPGEVLRERLLIIFIAPAVIAAIAVAVMCFRMNNARGKSMAADYAVPGSFTLNGALDILISSHVSRTPRNTDNGSHGGGGGSSHISHSGVSHGGGGRHF